MKIILKKYSSDTVVVSTTVKSCCGPAVLPWALISTEAAGELYGPEIERRITEDLRPGEQITFEIVVVGMIE